MWRRHRHTSQGASVTTGAPCIVDAMKKHFLLLTGLLLMMSVACAQKFTHTASNGIPLEYTINKKSSTVALTNHGNPCVGNLAIPPSVKHKSTEYPVTSIGALAFATCKKLTSVVLPNTVTTIGRLAFFNCSDLSGPLTIPESVTNIHSGAFSNCSGLTSVTFPNTVITIDDFAFEECSSLTSITALSPIPPRLGTGVFDGVSDTIPVRVPREAVTAYRADIGWRHFSNIQAARCPAVVTAEGNTIIISNAVGAQIRIFDMQGRLLSNQRVKENPYRLHVASAGAYLVQVDNGTAHRVVVQPQ